MANQQLTHVVAAYPMIGHVGRTQAIHGLVIREYHVDGRHRLGQHPGNLPTLLHQLRRNSRGIQDGFA